MAIEIVRCGNCKKWGTACCMLKNNRDKLDEDFCSRGERQENSNFEYVYTTEEVDRDIKVNLRLLDKFKEQLYAEYGDSIHDFLEMYETLYQEQMKEMPLPWYKYGFGSKEDNDTKQFERSDRTWRGRT